MPRSIWSGAISFGLVNVPVKLYSAVSRKSVRFHQLHDADGVRLQQKRVCPADGEEVPYEHVVKGYEISPDRYVVVQPRELDALAPEKTRTIEIESFVELDRIDPVYYDHPYYLVPGTGAAKPYRLLLEAMRSSGRVAIGRVVIRQREQLVAVRPAGDVLSMTTMLFADEVVSPEGLEEAESVRAVESGERELKVARQLVDSLSVEFEPERYRDGYRAAVLDLIERKAAGEEIAVQPEVEEPAEREVPDLMAALEASVERARADGGARSGAKRKRAAKANGKMSGTAKAKRPKPRVKPKAKPGAKR